MLNIEIVYLYHILVTFVLLHMKLHLKDVLVVFDLTKNLLSIGKFTSDNLCTFELLLLIFLLRTKTR